MCCNKAILAGPSTPHTANLITKTKHYQWLQFCLQFLLYEEKNLNILTCVITESHSLTINICLHRL